MPVYLGSCSIRGVAVKKHRHVCGVSMSQMEWGVWGSLCGPMLAALFPHAKSGLWP